MIVVLITLSIRTDSFYLFDGLMSIYRFDGNKLGILKIFASSTFGRKKCRDNQCTDFIYCEEKYREF